MHTPANPGGASATSAGAANVNPDVLGQRLTASLRTAERYTARLSKTSGALNLGGIVASAATTALTGWTSVAGPVFGDSVSAWRLTCILAAVLGFFSTVFIAVSQQTRLAERLARANECIGRLKSLEFALAAQTQSLQEVWMEYAEILKKYPEELR
jgi:hypothetical protein